MSILDGARTHYRVFGPRGLQWIALARLARRPMQIAVASADHIQPVHLRMRTTDVSVYEEIVANGEYRFEIAREPTVIVDAGANIGLTSIFFANRYPGAKVIAIEPEASNFRMLIKNCERYSTIVPIEAALWSSDTRVDLQDPGTGSWGFRTEDRQQVQDTGAPAQDTGAVARPGDDAGVRALTIPTLMREVGIDHIDILKVDIEGAEKEIFDHCDAWIDRIGVLAVELHDRWKPGCSEAVEAAARNFPITWTRGETTFFLRTAYHPKPPPGRRGDSPSRAHTAPPGGAGGRRRVTGVQFG